MTLQQLKYFVTVAECKNITSAAEKLFISQPSLSAAIHNFEKEMGVTAFARTNKGIKIPVRVKNYFHMHAIYLSRLIL